MTGSSPLSSRQIAGWTVGLVLAIGPPRMMQAVAETTRPHGIHTVVSLNSLMVDGGQLGQIIQVNDVLMVLEAMKMKTIITLPIAGKIQGKSQSR